MTDNLFYFFIGTEAELIKVFPIIKLMEDREIPYSVISSGQNDITQSRVLKCANNGRIDLELSREESITKTYFGLFKWYIKTRNCAKRQLVERFSDLKTRSIASKSIMIVHGDTISTVMGAYLARRLGMKIAHVEAGLRSHRIFNPFPEEIDRIMVDRISDYLFVPGQQGINNLKGFKKTIICDVKNKAFDASNIIVDILTKQIVDKNGCYSNRNRYIFDTGTNTLADSLVYSKDIPCDNDAVKQIVNQEYFIFVLHRQENIQNRELIDMLITQLHEAVKTMKCVVVMHKITKKRFEELGILDVLMNDERFILLERTDYFDFMKVLHKAEFVVTDGGSNQEELSYMGVPTLVIRKATERIEGLEGNVVLYEGNNEKVRLFFENYRKYRRNDISDKINT